MMILAGLSHIRETGKVPSNRGEIDEVCREVLKISPANSTVREWLAATRRRRLPSSRSAIKQG